MMSQCMHYSLHVHLSSKARWSISLFPSFLFLSEEGHSHPSTKINCMLCDVTIASFYRRSNSKKHKHTTQVLLKTSKINIISGQGNRLGLVIIFQFSSAERVISLQIITDNLEDDNYCEYYRPDKTIDLVFIIICQT